MKTTEPFGSAKMRRALWRVSQAAHEVENLQRTRAGWFVPLLAALAMMLVGTLRINSLAARLVARP